MLTWFSLGGPQMGDQELKQAHNCILVQKELKHFEIAL